MICQTGFGASPDRGSLLLSGGQDDDAGALFPCPSQCAGCDSFPVDSCPSCIYIFNDFMIFIFEVRLRHEESGNVTKSDLIELVPRDATQLRSVVQPRVVNIARR